MAKTGSVDPDWNKLKQQQPHLWEDTGLLEAGKHFAAFVNAQRTYYKSKQGSKRQNVEFAEKALNYAVISAWAYTAGVLSDNKVRLKRHFSLAQSKGKDPLNAAALAKARHKTDADSYRGLGYRTDAKERGRLAELFYLQAEKGEGITSRDIDLAIKKYHAKQASMDVWEIENKTII